MVAHLLYIIMTHRTARIHVRCMVFTSVLLEVFVGITEKLLQYSVFTSGATKEDKSTVVNRRDKAFVIIYDLSNQRNSLLRFHLDSLPSVTREQVSRVIIP